MEFPLLITYINKMDVFSYLLILLGNIENKMFEKNRSKIYKIIKNVTTHVRKGAGVTFDLTFFDNSKVATFD
jgi:hypothetical protein